MPISRRDTAQSYLDRHGLPSGGDWALPYSAAVKLNNTAGVVVDANLFTRMDGIGVTVYGGLGFGAAIFAG